MSKESEQPKPVNPQTESEYIPLKFPILITPFNIGEVISIRVMNDRNESRLKEKSKKV